MAYTYPLAEGTEDVLQRSSDLVVLIVPSREDVTFDFTSLESLGENVGFQGGFLMEKVINCTVRTSKAQHLSQVQITAIDAEDDYLRLFSPGDWIMVWMTDNREDAATIKANIREGKSCNEFNSGLKFVGRVYTQRRSEQIQPTQGTRVKRFLVTGVGFAELDTAVYYRPELFFRDQKDLFFMANLSQIVNKSEALPTKISEWFTTLTKAFLGVPPNDVQPLAQQNRTFAIPQVVGTLLGIDGASTYSDILTCYFGVQTYTGDGWVPVIKRTDGLRNYTPTELVGYFSPIVPPWSGQPLWAILRGYLNGEMNEMYTSLHLDAQNRIMPSFIVRQIPFNTDKLLTAGNDRREELFPAQENYQWAADPVVTNPANRAPTNYVTEGNLIVTPFSTLPRWKVTPNMVMAYDTGRSNAMRVNYVHVRSEPPLGLTAYSGMETALVKPRVDAIDIENHGLFIHTPTIKASLLTDGTNSYWEAGQQWTDIVTDRMMGGHLKLNGSLTTVGIQEPVCEGDNLEYDNFVYHIEQVIHTFTIEPNSGTRRFATTFLLSNGVPAHSETPLPETGQDSSAWHADSLPTTVDE